jgi:hypothetical protein
MTEYIKRQDAIDSFKVGKNTFARFCTLEEAIKNIESVEAADVVEIPQSGIGDLSDGYHTFNELYHHRAILFSVICNSMPNKAWKSKLHDTGDMYEGMFIVGIETPNGQATYHYDIDPYWNMFKVKELEKAPKWDGHTPQEAIERIFSLNAGAVEVRHGKWLVNNDEKDWEDNSTYKLYIECNKCGKTHFLGTTKYKNEYNEEKLKALGTYADYSYCGRCGAKMDGKGEGE